MKNLFPLRLCPNNNLPKPQILYPVLFIRDKLVNQLLLFCDTLFSTKVCQIMTISYRKTITIASIDEMKSLK